MRVEHHLGISSLESMPTDQVRDPEDLSTDELRQGVTGHGVRYVLIISLAGALIGMAVAWLVIA